MRYPDELPPPSRAGAAICVGKGCNRLFEVRAHGSQLGGDARIRWCPFCGTPIKDTYGELHLLPGFDPPL